MVIRLLRLYSDFMSQISLKVRFIGILFVNSAVVLLLVGGISWYTISGLHVSRVQSTIQSSLDSADKKIQKSFDDLVNVTNLFAFSGTTHPMGESIIDSLNTYIHYTDQSDLSSDQDILNFVYSSNKLRDGMTLVTMINREIGACLFFRKGNEEQNLISNYTIPDVDIGKFPEVAQSDYIRLCGLHPSITGSWYPVISVERRIDLPDGSKNVFVYVETGSEWFNDLAQNKDPGLQPFYLMTDADNRVIFSENQDEFSIGKSVIPSGKNPWKADGYYMFSSTGDSGWHIIEVISQENYEHEIVKWISQFVVIIIVCLAITFIVVLIIWRTIYRPIRVFRKEFQLLAENIPNPRIRRTRIKEFDELLVEFYRARLSVNNLLREVEQKERKQKEFEIEKLLIQINPHFVQNTLNSIQWIARLNDQKEIERMTMLFTEILGYNLGKKEMIVTVMEEVNMLENYVELQRMRYGFKLDVTVQVEPALKTFRIPRFILQPLVENAIFYGMNCDGIIVIRVSVLSAADGKFRIMVEDEGKGMMPEEIQKLMMEGNEWSRQIGMGIGLKYVDNMIRFYYGSTYKINIISKPGEGTAVIMDLPDSTMTGRGGKIGNHVTA